MIDIQEVLRALAAGEVSPAQAQEAIEDLFQTTLHDALRQKAEVIFDAYATAALSSLTFKANDEEGADVIAEHAMAIAIACMEKRVGALTVLGIMGEDEDDDD